MPLKVLYGKRWASERTVPLSSRDKRKIPTSIDFCEPLKPKAESGYLSMRNDSLPTAKGSCSPVL